MGKLWGNFLGHWGVPAPPVEEAGALCAVPKALGLKASGGQCGHVAAAFFIFCLLLFPLTGQFGFDAVPAIF